MKRDFIWMVALLLGSSINICAQNEKQSGADVIILLKESSIFSSCFQNIDTNGDGVVDSAEAAAATILTLDKGGRSNIITDYGFLKHFPNLKALSVGNTTETVIDLHYQTKLEKLNLTNALWIEKIILAEDCVPEIIYPTGKTYVEMQHYINDDTIRALMDEYSYCEKIEQDGEAYYIVSKEYGAYGLWHRGVLEVPCKYGLDELKELYFVVSNTHHSWYSSVTEREYGVIAENIKGNAYDCMIYGQSLYKYIPIVGCRVASKDIPAFVKELRFFAEQAGEWFEKKAPITGVEDCGQVFKSNFKKVTAWFDMGTPPEPQYYTMNNAHIEAYSKMLFFGVGSVCLSVAPIVDKDGNRHPGLILPFGSKQEIEAFISAIEKTASK